MSLSRQRKISKEITRQINSRLPMIHDPFFCFPSLENNENTSSPEKEKNVFVHIRCLTRRKKQIPVITIDIPNEY